MGKPRRGVTAQDRFWAAVRKTRGCWLWVGYSHNGRYGRLQVGGKDVLAHVYSFFLANGRWPKLKTLHTCDVSLCVKPIHLYEGSNTQNMRDRLRRHGRKLTAKQAVWCRGKDVKLIMRKFKVFFTHAYALKRGAYWKWLT